MANLLLKVGPGAGYEDGDPIAAFSRRCIMLVHAEHLCFPRGPDRRFERLNGAGLFDLDDPARDYCEITREFRIDRLSLYEARKVRLADGAEIRFESNKPFADFDGRTVAMDVPEFFARRIRTLRLRNAQGVPLFGTDAAKPSIYGGRTDVSLPKVAAVWSAIEAKLGRGREEPVWRHWPMGRLDVRNHLPIGTDDFDDVAAESLVAPERFGEIVTRKRANRLDYAALLSSDDLARARDPEQAFDLRELTTISRTLIRQKQERIR